MSRLPGHGLTSSGSTGTIRISDSGQMLSSHAHTDLHNRAAMLTTFTDHVLLPISLPFEHCALNNRVRTLYKNDCAVAFSYRCLFKLTLAQKNCYKINVTAHYFTQHAMFKRRQYCRFHLRSNIACTVRETAYVH